MNDVTKPEELQIDENTGKHAYIPSERKCLTSWSIREILLSMDKYKAKTKEAVR